MNKDAYVVSEHAQLIIFGSKSTVCMDRNGKYNKQTINIAKRMQFLRNGKECNYHKTVWCEVRLQMAYIRTNNVKEDELNTILGYAMVILKN